MKVKSILIGCVSGIVVGILICFVYQNVSHNANVNMTKGFGASEEWNSFSIQERTIYTEGYVEGYSIGTRAVCENADKLFTDPVKICDASLDRFTRAGEPGKTRLNYSVYSDVITEFYHKYPKYNHVPFSFLLTLLSDKNFKTADQLFQKLEKHDMQITF